MVIEDFLQNKAPTFPLQWEFMANRSTVSALLRVVEDWFQALIHSHEVCVVIFDVSKAFDYILYLPLLFQMYKLGINPYLLRWLSQTNHSMFALMAVALMCYQCWYHCCLYAI